MMNTGIEYYPLKLNSECENSFLTFLFFNKSKHNDVDDSNNQSKYFLSYEDLNN